jgi:hypothetical protein
MAKPLLPDDPWDLIAPLLPSEPDRSRQGRHEAPPRHRPAGHAAGDPPDRGQPPRVDGVRGPRRRRPADQGTGGAAAQAAGQTPRRQGRRHPALPAPSGLSTSGHAPRLGRGRVQPSGEGLRRLVFPLPAGGEVGRGRDGRHAQDPSAGKGLQTGAPRWPHGRVFFPEQNAQSVPHYSRAASAQSANGRPIVCRIISWSRFPAW